MKHSVKELYEKGLSLRDICSLIKKQDGSSYSHEAIRLQLKNQGITLRRRGRPSNGG